MIVTAKEEWLPNKLAPPQSRSSISTSTRPTLVIHGGAGPAAKPNIPPEQEEAYRAALRKSLARGNAILEAGGSALDAVCAAVASMEDDPLFNSGHGAVFNKAGFNELEASVMVAVPKAAQTPKDNRRCASAILVRNTRNPIMLAKALLLHASKNPHVVLSGRTAEEIGWSAGCDKVDSSYYYTRERWLEHRRELGLPEDVDPARCDSGANQTNLFEVMSDLSEGTTALDTPLSGSPRPPPSYSSLATPSLVRSSSQNDEKEASTQNNSSDSDSIVMTPSNRNSIDDSRGDLGMEGLWTFDWHGSHPEAEAEATEASSTAESISAALSQQEQIEAREQQVAGPLDWRPTGTVGAVALDAKGHLACATSTGGITNKLPGRIGDTPTPGAGFWAEYWNPHDQGVMQPGRIVRHSPQASTTKNAGKGKSTLSCFPAFSWLCGMGTLDADDDENEEDEQQEKVEQKLHSSAARKYARGVAVSGTGTGDYFLRCSFGSLLVHRMRFLGEDVDSAGQHAIDEMGHLGGVGGAICIDEAGQVSFPYFGSATFNRGYIRPGHRAKVAVYADEECA